MLAMRRRAFGHDHHELHDQVFFMRLKIAPARDVPDDHDGLSVSTKDHMKNSDRW